MGIRGLQTYLEHNSPDMCYWVSLQEMADTYKLNNPSLQQVVIVVDGSSCASWIFGKNNWVCGGQWLEYQMALQTFVEAFRNIGITLVIFFDGLTAVSKPDMWSTRRLKEITDVKVLFQCIKQKEPIPHNMFIIPPNTVKLLPIALKYIHGVRVYYNVSGECDQTIASYAAQHNCMAILAQDTDYVIYKTAPYLSMQHLDLKTMKTMIYCRESFCNELRLEVASLPLVACLLGNDYISRDSLKRFHNWACRIFGRHKSSQRQPYFGKILSSVKHYISSLKLENYNTEVKSRINDICYTVYGRSFSTKDFLKSLETYEINYCDPNLYPPPGATDMQLQALQRDDIYEVLLRKTTTLEISALLLNILTFGKTELSVTLEDKSNIQIVSHVIIYRPIRQRLYHLIFLLRNNFLKSNKPLTLTGQPVNRFDFVEEWYAASWKHIAKDKVAAKTPRHLDEELSKSFYDVVIHNKEDKSNSQKWKVFQEIMEVTITLETLHTVPKQYIPLCIIINYLIQNPGVPVELWEVDVFVAQAVHPKASDISWHSDLQVTTYNSRAVHFAALFLRGVGAAFDIASICGDIVENQYFMPWNFFDGKRFHHCYTEIQKCRDVAKLFSNEVLALEKFQLLRSAILEGIDMVKCFSLQTS